jgi:NDP-sugar pyrophosphorylase family protein
MKGFILSAGLGERLRPITNYIPKPLVRFGDRTVFEIIVEKFKKLNINKIAINLYHLSEIFERFLSVKKFEVDIKVYKEKTLLGTGGALKNISDFIDDFILVHNGDIITDFDLLEAFEFHKNSKNTVTLCIMKRESSRVLVFDDDMKLTGWINHDKNLYKGNISGNIYSFTGIYFLSPNIVKYFPKDDVFSLFDFLMNTKEIIVRGFVVNPKYWFDIGNIEKLSKAREFFKEVI